MCRQRQDGAEGLDPPFGYKLPPAPPPPPLKIPGFVMVEVA